MRVFLSHSGHDAAIVKEVWEGLGPRVAWVDKADIDLGDIVLEKIAAGIEEATDFVLFWSKSASESPWVRIELHMGFLRFLEQSGCQLRVVKLDEAVLPLYLRPFLYLDVSESLSEAPRVIVGRLLSEHGIARGAVRRLFVNRHDELKRLELAIDDYETRTILLHGLPGIGKASLVNRAVETFFSPPHVSEIVVRPGTGWVELALQLCAMAGLPIVEDGAADEEVQSSARTAIEQLLDSGAILAIHEVQHWVEEDGLPSPILAALLEWFGSMPSMSGRPALMTSRRLPRLDPEQRQSVQVVRIEGIPDEHLSGLVRHWYAVETGKSEFDETRLKAFAANLCGYPLAARIAASLLAQYGIDFVLKYPREVIELRIDIATRILAEAKVSEQGVGILEALAILDTPMPSAHVATALRLSPDEFRGGVDSALSFGLLSMDGLALTLHPLVKDFYWRAIYHSEAYHDVVSRLADEGKKHLSTLEVGSEGYAKFLPTVFRLIALTGDIDGARQLRRDLVGTLLETAIQLYNRREYDTSLKYGEIILTQWPNDWRARLYRARCLTRLGRLGEAKKLLLQLHDEQPWSNPVVHALGRLEMEEDEWETALAWFSRGLRLWADHIPCLRDSAECYLRLEDLSNAEILVKRAKEVDSTNPYVLQIESQILEAQGHWEEAYAVMNLARDQDPERAAFAHRLGRIAGGRGDLRKALEHYDDALSIDEHFWEARMSKASVLIDLRELEAAAEEIDRLKHDVRGKRVAVVDGIEAKLYLAKEDLDKARRAIGRVGRKGSAVAFGTRARIEMKQASIHRRNGYLKLAEQALADARSYTKSGLEHYPDNGELLQLQQELDGIDGSEETT